MVSVNSTNHTFVPPPVWRYNRTICTGLGDRLGAMMTVATLAYISNVEVEMEWCGDPSVIYPNLRTYVPDWVGFNYPLDTFLQTFEIPKNVRLVKRYSTDFLPEVSYTGNELVAQEARDQVYTLAWRTTRIGHAAEYNDFVRAYHVVGAQFKSKGHRQLQGSYFVLHMRAWDANTFAYGWDPSLFCTHKVVSSVLKHGLKVVVVSNDLIWARETLQPLKRLSFFNGTAFEDMALLLSADGIIQHAPPGYSSYSNVPAMAKGIPLISTFKGQYHRFKLHLESGEIPSEFYTCSTRGAFSKRVVEKLKLKNASLGN